MKNFKWAIVKLVLVLGLSIGVWGEVVNTEPTSLNLTKLYVATFGRAPDSAGIDYWRNDSGLGLEDIARSFFDQPETQSKYADKNNREFIGLVYQNLFNRDPDDAGWDYWEDELDSGKVEKSVFILAVINGALGDDATILENKTEVGLYFMQKGLNENYDVVIQGVTADKSSVDYIKNKIDEGYIYDDVWGAFNDNLSTNIEVNQSAIYSYKLDTTTIPDTGVIVTTVLEKRDSGEYRGTTTIDIDAKKAEIYFPISDTTLFDLNSSELLSQNKIDITVEKNDGEYILNIPKELIKSWQDSGASIFIDGEPADIKIIEDDPVIGWNFEDDKEDNGFYNDIYMNDFVRPFNYNNLSVMGIYGGGPFYDIKSNANAKQSLISSSDTWSDFTDSIGLKYQVLYYTNSGYWDDSLKRTIQVSVNLKELDLFFDDYSDVQYKDIVANMPEKNESVYYIIGPDNYVAIDARTNIIVDTSIDDILNKNFSDVIYEEDFQGLNTSLFDKIGYFNWSYDFSKLDVFLASDLEFMPYIEVDDNGNMENYGAQYDTIKSWFGSYKEVKYITPTIQLLSDFSGKSFVDGETIDIEWKAENWSSGDVYISMQCKDNDSEEWWLIDTVSNKPDQNNTYSWEIGAFQGDSSLWSSVNHDECRIEVAKNVVHTYGSRSEYFKIIEESTSEPSSDSDIVESIKTQFGPVDNQFIKTGGIVSFNGNWLLTYSDGHETSLPSGTTFAVDDESVLKIGSNGSIDALECGSTNVKVTLPTGQNLDIVLSVDEGGYSYDVDDWVYDARYTGILCGNKVAELSTPLINNGYSFNVAIYDSDTIDDDVVEVFTPDHKRLTFTLEGDEINIGDYRNQKILIRSISTGSDGPTTLGIKVRSLKDDSVIYSNSVDMKKGEWISLYIDI